MTMLNTTVEADIGHEADMRRRWRRQDREVLVALALAHPDRVVPGAFLRDAEFAARFKHALMRARVMRGRRAW